MIKCKITYIDGGSPEYWRQRTEGFRLIHEAERAAAKLEKAPMYIAGDWDEDYGDYTPVENLAPFDRMDDAIRAIEANETAVSILVAQRRSRIGSYEIGAVLRELSPEDGHIEDRVSNPLWGPDTD